MRRSTAPRPPRREPDAKSGAAPAAAAPFVPPYAPSWFDRLKRRVERVPGPYWLAYVVLGMVFFAAETALHVGPPLPLFDPALCPAEHHSAS